MSGSSAGPVLDWAAPCCLAAAVLGDEDDIDIATLQLGEDSQEGQVRQRRYGSHRFQSNSNINSKYYTDCKQ